MSDQVITMAPGGGGAASQRLLSAEILSLLAPDQAECLEDAALVAWPASPGGLVYTTDGFIVQPLVFPGGDIGKLAVCGTVNDLAMRGAKPELLTVSMILEEGLDVAVLRQAVVSMKAVTEAVGASIVAGDTKVVERGKGDGMFLSLSGIGRPQVTPAPSARRAEPGDQVLINGTIGDHGVAVLAAREQLGFTTTVTSDCAPLWGIVQAMLGAGGTGVHVLRDPTRGGVAAGLNEIAQSSGIGIVLRQESLPVDPAVQGACDLLGFDPLTIANEGKVMAIVAPERAADVLAAMRQHPLGQHSAVIGEVIAEQPGRVLMQTVLGPRRLVDMPSGELLPRIC
jgi:hydrogenase expression/formation protein HypE